MAQARKRKNDYTAKVRQARRVEKEEQMGIRRVLLKVPIDMVDAFKGMSVAAVQAHLRHNPPPPEPHPSESQQR